MTFSWRDFQIWFEGFSENIEGSPSDTQWRRVCKRIAEVGSGPEAAAPVAVQAVAPAAPPVEAKPKRPTIAQWRRQFIDEMQELGYDPETAKEMMPPKIDTAIDPAAAARMEHAGGGAMH